MTMFYVLVGFIIGIVFIKLRDRIERWYYRQQTKELIHARLNEMNNGRQNQGLTVKIDPVS